MDGYVSNDKLKDGSIAHESESLGCTITMIDNFWTQNSFSRKELSVHVRPLEMSMEKAIMKGEGYNKKKAEEERVTLCHW